VEGEVHQTPVSLAACRWGMSDICPTGEHREEEELRIHQPDSVVFPLVVMNAAHESSASAMTIRSVSGGAQRLQ